MLLDITDRKHSVAQTGAPKANHEANAPKVRVWADFAFDVSEERLLVGFADNVFVGRLDRN